MRLDGEPWKQPLPVDDDTVVVEISHFGQVSVLATTLCRSKSVYDPASPDSPASSRDEEDDSNDDIDSEDMEERRKFGASNTFKLPEDIYLAQLS